MRQVCTSLSAKMSSWWDISQGCSIITTLRLWISRSSKRGTRWCLFFKTSRSHLSSMLIMYWKGLPPQWPSRNHGGGTLATKTRLKAFIAKWRRIELLFTSSASSGTPSIPIGFTFTKNWLGIWANSKLLQSSILYPSIWTWIRSSSLLIKALSFSGWGLPEADTQLAWQKNSSSPYSRKRSGIPILKGSD